MAYTNATEGAADTYLSWSSDWAAATSAEKLRGLDAGEFALEAAMVWDDDVTPGTTDDIVNASIELALADVQGRLYPTGQSHQPVIEEEQIGPLRRKYRSSGGSGRGGLFARFPKVWHMVQAYGSRADTVQMLQRA